MQDWFPTSLEEAESQYPHTRNAVWGHGNPTGQRLGETRFQPFWRKISHTVYKIRKDMIIRNWHTREVASLQNAVIGLVDDPQTALCLSGVIGTMPFRGIAVAIVDNRASKRMCYNLIFNK